MVRFVEATIVTVVPNGRGRRDVILLGSEKISISITNVMKISLIFISMSDLLTLEQNSLLKSFVDVYRIFAGVRERIKVYLILSLRQQQR